MNVRTKNHPTKLALRLLLAKLHKAYHPEINVLPKAKIFISENQYSAHAL